MPKIPEAKQGFSLLEAMVALAIASIIFAAIATLGSQVLRNWMRGQETLSALEMLQRGLGRLQTDLSLALPMPLPGSDTSEILFTGDERSLMFPAATGFGAGNHGLELLSLAVVPDGEGAVLVRKRGPIANLGTILADPVALLRGRMSLSFSYRDAAGVMSSTWQHRTELPAAVLVNLRGASGALLFPSAVSLPMPTNLSAECLPAPGASAAKSKPAEKSSRCGPAGGSAGTSNAETNAADGKNGDSDDAGQ